MGAAILNFMTRYGCRYCYSVEVLLCETIDLFTDTAAILNNLISQYIMGCTGGKECSRDWSRLLLSLDSAVHTCQSPFSHG